MAVPDRIEDDEAGNDYSEQTNDRNLQIWITDNLGNGGLAGTAALATKISLELVLAGGIVGTFLILGVLSVSVLPGVSITANELVRALAAGALGVYGIGTHCYYGAGDGSGIQ